MATYNGVRSNYNSGSATSIACSASISVAVGDLVHVGVTCEGGSTTVSVADGLGNTYTEVENENYSGGEPQLAVFECFVTAAGTATPTATFGASRSHLGINAHFFTPGGGNAFASDTPGSVIAEGSSATLLSSGSLSISAAGAASAFFGTYRAAGVTPGTGWTETVDVDTAYAEYRLPSGSGSITGDATHGGGSDRFMAAAIHTIEVAGATVDQVAFRFYDDDGDEDGSTATASQGSDITTATALNKHLRLLLQAAGDPASVAYTLRAQKNGSGGYTEVAVGSSTTVAPTVEAGDVTESGNNTATTSWAVSYPAYVSGDLLIFHVASDANVTHDWPATGPNGETINTIVDSTGGTAQRASGFWFVGTGTISSGTLTVTPSATEQWTAAVLKVPAGEFNSSTPIQTNIGTDNDTTANTSWDTPAWTSDATADGRVVCFAAHDAVTTSATPAGWDTLAARDRGEVGCTLASRQAANTSSESIASASFTKTSESDSSFGYVINGATVDNEVFISPSAQFSNGQATTARLTGGTGAFVAGAINDTANGITVNITEDDNTEVAWCLQLASSLSGGDYFDFRAYAGSSALGAYTDTPRWTVTGGGGGGGFTLPTMWQQINPLLRM